MPTSLRDLDPALRDRLARLNELDLKLFRTIVEWAGSDSRTRHYVIPAVAKPAGDVGAARTTGSVALQPVGSDTLMFMHIVKTGGTSIRHALLDAYGPDERLFVYEPADLEGAVHPDDVAELPEERRQRLRLVMGHYRFGLHRSVGRPCRYVAIVREPVERTVSLYYHHLHLRGYQLRRLRLLRVGRAQREQARIRQQGVSLEQWVFDKGRLTVDNGMTRLLAARRGVRFGECPDDLLDEAIKHVDRHFAALLVSDELSRSHELLTAITGRELAPITRKNVNAKRPGLEELDPKLVERIRQLNHLDLKLYEYARERLHNLLP